MRKALGKGLEALIPEIGNALLTPAITGEVTVKIPVKKIKPNKYQSREKFDETKLKTLADSILEHGLAQPITVRPSNENGTYELVMGERRWRASMLAGLSEIPAIIKPLSEKECFVISLIENLQRSDLNPIEEAKGYKRLMGEFNLTQEDLAKTLGKSRSTVANITRLLSLPKNIQDAISEGKITEGHARAIASIDSPLKQRMLLERIINQQLTVRDVEKISKNSKKSKSKKDSNIIAVEEELQRILGTKVEIKYRGGKGKIIVSCASLNDLNRIVNILRHKSKK
ncbi:MAG: chromosome partitioning protein ParB [Elusimicrobia bacterium CG06_land_8_20_14_3_00_38_11]|nr:MAG: chromosome partitioning protein ParB [Elusimicrobia bacterium CG06_land_8_20_14_3_00_38_11]